MDADSLIKQFNANLILLKAIFNGEVKIEGEADNAIAAYYLLDPFLIQYGVAYPIRDSIRQTTKRGVIKVTIGSNPDLANALLKTSLAYNLDIGSFRAAYTTVKKRIVKRKEALLSGSLFGFLRRNPQYLNEFSDDILHYAKHPSKYVKANAISLLGSIRPVAPKTIQFVCRIVHLKKYRMCRPYCLESIIAWTSPDVIRIIPTKVLNDMMKTLVFITKTSSRLEKKDLKELISTIEVERSKRKT